MSKSITVRVQSAEHGTRRFETKTSETVADFLNKIQHDFELGDLGWNLYQQRNKTGVIRTSRSKKMDSYKVKHGDMLYLMIDDKNSKSRDDLSQKMETENGSVMSELKIGNASSSNDVLDEVDIILEKTDGKIYRKRNEQLCRHGPQGKCLHCVPLEPYDEEFLKSCDPPIKFLSFHSYIRKLTGGIDKGKFVNLENISCKIKSGCKEHPPWPGGICTKCQPNAVTLKRQTYRHVDNIMFENASIADRFLNFWRSTGNQHCGILYGRYEPFKDTPLGIKATITAIYEPPQKSSRNKIELLEDNNDTVNAVAEKLGLKAIGWIFTDLVAECLQQGTVKNFRGKVDSHFLSAEECIMAGHFQNRYPNPCPTNLSSDGHFGSKFVTVIVTGDSNNQIHFEGYQVSNQCMALVRDDCLIPTKDVPELGYVKESSNEQYVPDVFFKDKDNYGNEVTQLARPLPVEYLLVEIPAAFPVEPQFTFRVTEDIKPFVIENREEVGDVQDFNALVQHLRQFAPDKFLDAMSDFHLLIYLAKTEMLPLREKMGMLLEAVKNKDEDMAHHFMKTEEWATVEQMMSAHSPSVPSLQQQSYNGSGAMAAQPQGGTSEPWTCAHCTFINQAGFSTCDMCSLPRQ
ncbi:nuclear protein localization protein 4 homolog [Patella vulgata]|uniref:nuclear protein localization protein 4 homolog n=1 Tax=Patella vulgata TaxID=6465 RepID=UPI002180385D|nr:nuclear protein localization protein 4 homolog [Patella vulgata]